MTEDQINFVAGRYRCVAVRCDLPWGHGLRVRLYDGRNDALLHTVKFACHPEFAGYDQLQAMNTEQLISLAQARLESGLLDESLAKARAGGLTLIIRLEAPIA